MSKDPYIIAKENNILIVAEPLAKIGGYYNKVMNQKFIHINDGLPEHFQKYIVAFLLRSALHRPNEMLFLTRDQVQREMNERWLAE